MVALSSWSSSAVVRSSSWSAVPWSSWSRHAVVDVVVGALVRDEVRRQPHAVEMRRRLHCGCPVPWRAAAPRP